MKFLNNKLKIFLFLTLIVGLIFSLKQLLNWNKSYEKYSDNFILVKVDEFKINFLGKTEIIDYDPVGKLFLGYTIDNVGLNVILVDENGKVIIEKNLKGEGPGMYNSNICSLSFSEDGNIWLLSTNQLLLLDKNLSLIKNIKYEPDFFISFYNNAEKLFFYNIENKNNEIVFATNPSGISRNLLQDKINFEDRQLLQFHNTFENNKINIGLINDRRISQDSWKKISTLYNPVYHINKTSKTLYLTTNIDDEISIIDLKYKQEIRKVKINFESPFNLTEKKKINIENYPKTSDGILITQNKSILEINSNLFALLYIKGAKLELPSPEKNNKTRDFMGGILNKTGNQELILFNNFKQISSNISIPEYGKVNISLPQNRILLKIENPEVEKDYIQYHIYEIKEMTSLRNPS